MVQYGYRAVPGAGFGRLHEVQEGSRGEHGADAPIERVGDLQGDVLGDHDGLAAAEHVTLQERAKCVA